jgi:hypothetical protein
MKMTRRFGLILAVLLPACAATAAQVVTVQDVVDYTANYWDEDSGVWFLVPKEVYEDPCNWYEDHPPWHRGSNQDWGWLHNVSARVPMDATGIASATLTIMAWDVDSSEGEDDVIFANSRYLGELTGVDRDWQAVTFDLPAAVLNDLWNNSQLYIYMDIDQILDPSVGYRVTLKSSTLTIKYNTSGTAPATVPVYRFWSPLTSGHFYTMDETEKDHILATYPSSVWTYEGINYKALLTAGNTAARPIYRFWSPSALGHFYTIDEAERDKLLTTYPSSVWTYEGIAFYAFAEGEQPASAMPVYRFWSPLVSHHFFTMDQTERDHVLATYSADVWTYEGVAWYAFQP